MESQALFPQVEGGNARMSGWPGWSTEAEYKIAAKGESNRHIMKDVFLSRRRCLQVSALAGCSMLLGGRVSSAEEPLPAGYIPPGQLSSLMEQLAKAPRRRDCKAVPKISTRCLWGCAPAGVVAQRRRRAEGGV